MAEPSAARRTIFNYELRGCSRALSLFDGTGGPKTRVTQVSSKPPNAWAERIAGAGIAPASSMLAM